MECQHFWTQVYIYFHLAPSAATFHFQLENGQVVELWLNALLANFENQKNENVGSVAITLGKEKPRFCDSNLLSFYFYWVSRRYNYLNLKLKKKKWIWGWFELMKVRFLKVCGSKLDNTKKILMSKNSTPFFPTFIFQWL